jgi:hypothetical protein
MSEFYSNESDEDRLKMITRKDVSNTKDKILDHMEKLRNKSGNISFRCGITEFIYVLVRDHMKISDIENLLLKHVNGKKNIYTNGWLAKYSNYVAERLKEKGYENIQFGIRRPEEVFLVEQDCGDSIHYSISEKIPDKIKHKKYCKISLKDVEWISLED